VPKYSSRRGSDVNIIVFQVPKPVHSGSPCVQVEYIVPVYLSGQWVTVCA